MKRSVSSLLALAVLVAPVAGRAAPQPDVTAVLHGPNSTVLGSVSVSDLPHGVLLRVEATGLPPGWHGIHFHEHGECSDAAFKSAGGHVHGDMAMVHGLRNANATDDGDLPNLFVGPDGRGTVELYSTLVAVHPGTNRPALLDADGAAVVIHASPDDYSTQPIGGSGARIACAVLR